MANNKDKKLCGLVKDKCLKEDPQAYAKLVDSPAYFCKKCGRSANKKKNLCKPAGL